MIEIQGDLFASKHRVIGHGVNLEGVMGAGVAKVVKDRFPEAYNDYRRSLKDGCLGAGGVLFSATFGDKIIAHMATQELRGSEASLPLVVSSAMVALDAAAEIGEDTVAIPRIGCGIGGLIWNDKYVGVRETLLVVEQMFNSIYVDRPYTEFAVYSL